MASIIDEQKENDCLGLSRNRPDQFYYLKKEVTGVTFYMNWITTMNNNHERSWSHNENEIWNILWEKAAVELNAQFITS